MRSGVTGVAVAAGLAVVASLATGTAALANTATTHNWITAANNIHLLDTSHPSTAHYFFDRTGSYGAGDQPGTSPIMDGFATTPVLQYASFEEFSQAIKANAINKKIYHWVEYDIEKWAKTPGDEQRDPGGAMAAFARLAHSNNLKVVMTPGRDLAFVRNTSCARKRLEGADSWYLRCHIAGQAAVGDLVVVQTEGDTTDVAAYDHLFNVAKAQIQAKSRTCPADAEVYTGDGTVTQMAAAAKSVKAAGYYTSVKPGTIDKWNSFLILMKQGGF